MKDLIIDNYIEVWYYKYELIWQRDGFMEGFNISRIEKIPDCTLICAGGIKGTAQTAYRLFSLFEKNGIKTVFVLLSTNIENESADLGIVIKSQDTEKAKLLADEIFFDGRTVVKEDISVISIVGTGLYHNGAVSAKIFELFYERGIDIHLISTGEIKIFAAVDSDKADEARQALLHGLDEM